MVLVLVLFVESAHTKSIPFGPYPSLFHVAVPCPSKICYLKLPTSWLRTSAEIDPSNPAFLYWDLVRLSIYLSIFTQEPKYADRGSGKDKTGTSLGRRCSLISLAITVACLEGKWVRLSVKRGRQAGREISLLRGNYWSTQRQDVILA